MFVNVDANFKLRLTDLTLITDTANRDTPTDTANPRLH